MFFYVIKEMLVVLYDAYLVYKKNAEYVKGFKINKNKKTFYFFFLINLL